MRQMVLRFFWYIWFAILGTALLVIALTISLGLPPPGHVPVKVVAGPLQAAAREAFAAGGAAAVRQLLDSDLSLSGQFEMTRRAGVDCAGPDMVGREDGGACLLLRADPPLEAGLKRFLPFLVPMTIGGALSLVAALLLAGRFVRPIRRIAEGLADLSRGHLDRRIGPSLDRSEPAIADVGRAFDAAAGKLQDLTESRTRLFHDISHEIRSPLARLQAETALLRRNPNRLDALLPRMEGDIARMDHLVGEILTLARLEHGGATELRPVAMDLVDLLDPILRDAELEGQARHIGVGYAGPEHVGISCDPELMHRAFENIMRNALRYAPEGSTVDVAVTVDTKTARVAISDRGPGVPDARLAKVFQAFIRDEAGQGAGLGLAIAANAIRLHGGNISAKNRAGGGFEVTCILPLAGRV